MPGGWGRGIIAIALTGALLAPCVARAGRTFIWDPDTTEGLQGGSSTWNTTTQSWIEDALRVQWASGAANTAILGGAASGAVSLGSDITAGTVQFDTAGYAIGSAQRTLTINGGTIITNADAQIDAVMIASTGFTKTGAGTLAISRDNTIGGTLRVSEGTLAFSKGSHLGSPTLIELAGGTTLRHTGLTDTLLASGRVISLGAGTVSIGPDSAIVRLDNVGQLTGAGTLRKVGGGTFAIRQANTNFTGPVSVTQGILELGHALAVNARPIELTGGTLELHANNSTDFASDVTVIAGTSPTLRSNYLIDMGNLNVAHAIGALDVRTGATLTVAGNGYRYHVAADSVNLAGNVLFNNSGLRVNGALTGAGTLRFGAIVQLVEQGCAGLIIAGPSARTVVSPVRVEDNADAKAVLAAIQGATLTYDADWQATGATAQSHIVLRDASRAILGAAAHVNTTAPDGLSSRYFRAVGTGPDNVLELSAAFVADRSSNGAVADGLGALEVRSATLLTRASASLPQIVRPALIAGGAPVRAGAIVFTSNGAVGAEPRWTVADAEQRYEAQVTFNSSATIQTDRNLTHAGSATAGFDGQFQVPTSGVTLQKTGDATLTLAGHQGYIAGTALNVAAGAVRFETDPGAGWYSGNFVRNADGTIATAPVAASTLSLYVGGTGAAAEIAAPVARLAGVQIGAGGTVRLVTGQAPASAPRALVATALAIPDSGVLDLGDGILVIDYSETTPAAAIAALVKRGYSAPATRWQGSGITSTPAQTDTELAIGYAEAAQLLSFSQSTLAPFGPVQVDSTSILVRVTRAADATLDGRVNFDDLLLLAQNYNTTGATWSRADFTYDGKVDFDDLLLLAQNYNTSLAASAAQLESALAAAQAPASFASDWNRAWAAVPEPSSGLLLLGCLAIGSRQRRVRAACTRA